MSVRGKFRVTKVEPVGGESGTHVYLSAVTDGSKENKALFNSTPNAEIKLLTVRTDVAMQFKFGDEYYVDLTKVE